MLLLRVTSKIKLFIVIIMTEFILDSGEIFKHERTPQGYLRIWMAVSKLGDLTYYDRQGNKRVETVTKETLFDSQSYDTAWGIPITFKDHPKDQNGYHTLNSKNARYDIRGMAMQSMLPDNGKLNVLGVVFDQEAIEGIEKGITQISAAYTRDLKQDGDRLIQTNRRYDHYTILENGRAGKEASVYYDCNNYDILGGPIIHDETGKIKTQSNSNDRIKSNKLDLIHIL